MQIYIEKHVFLHFLEILIIFIEKNLLKLWIQFIIRLLAY